MGVSDQELRAFLRGGGPSASANPPDVSVTELRKQLREDSLLSSLPLSPTTRSSPVPATTNKDVHEASLTPNLRAVSWELPVYRTC